MVILRRKHTSDYHLGQNVITSKDRDDLVIFGTEKIGLVPTGENSIWRM